MTGRFALVGLSCLIGCSAEAPQKPAVVGLQRTAGYVCRIPEQSDDYARQVVDLVNQERTSRGLTPLSIDDTLTAIAADYACEMIEGGFFDHVNPEDEGPGLRAIRHNYTFLAIGENLAGGQTTPEQVVREWMESTAGHRENILGAQWSEIGVALRTGGDHGIYWVQEFGSPP